MSWLTDPEEAAKHPRRVLAAMLMLGLVLGGAIGYLQFDGSPTWAVVLGVSFGVLLAFAQWRTMRDPDWVQRRKPRPGTRKALLRLAMPPLVLVVAYVLDDATHSVNVFIVAVAVGLAVALAVRFTVLR